MLQRRPVPGNTLADWLSAERGLQHIPQVLEVCELRLIPGQRGKLHQVTQNTEIAWLTHKRHMYPIDINVFREVFLRELLSTIIF